MSEQNINASIRRVSVDTERQGKLQRLVARSARTLRANGVRALASALRSMVLYRVHAKWLDRMAGPEAPSVSRTTELAGLNVTGENFEDAVEYAPTPRLVIKWVQDLLPGNVCDWTFVDVGAGRGRVVMAAARMGYRQVLGIEFAAELQRDASINIDEMPRDEKTSRLVAVLNANAADFDIPDGPCIFYLFNPFGAPVVDAFLQNVMTSYKRDPRPMRIAYFNPVHCGVMDQFPQIQKVPLSLASRAKFATFSPHDFKMYAIGAE